MKKIVLTLLAIALSLLTLTACKPTLKQYDAHISEIRSNLFEGKAGGMEADAITGYREEPFEINGASNSKQVFTVITIYPSEYNASIKYGYTVTIDGIEYSGDMLKHPFNNTFSAEIQSLTTSSKIQLCITHGTGSVSGELNSIIEDDYIDAEKALQIALKKLSSGIRHLKNNNISYEIYIRLLKNPVSNSGGYHWYVAFVGENDLTYAVLIHPITLEIVAIRD